METRCTLLKAASVILASIIIGTSCKKEALTPLEDNSMNSSSLNNLTAVGPNEMNYKLGNKDGLLLGEVIISSQKDMAEIQVIVDASIISNSRDIEAVLLDPGGQKIAVLAIFEKYSYHDKPAHLSYNFPVIDQNSGNKMMFSDFYSGKSYSIAIYHQKEGIIAKALIQ
jgi:hypothetical protein